MPLWCRRMTGLKLYCLYDVVNDIRPHHYDAAHCYTCSEIYLSLCLCVSIGQERKPFKNW